MRTRGWQGDPPRDDNEARIRILEAGKRCVDRFGPDRTRLADVAAELGVTRQTVYHYFSSVNEMLVAVAVRGADEFLDRMARDLAHVTTPAQAVTETVVYCLRTLPTEPTLGLLMRVGDTELFTRGATSSQAIALGAGMLGRFPIDWSAAGLHTDDLSGLAEVVIRLLVSFLQYPTDPPRSDDQIRAFLSMWVVPAVSPRPRARVARA